MYLNYYKLKLMPFEIGPDPKFLWLGSKHKEAFAALLYSILQSKGFIVILGEPGTGKSTLLNATEANFGSNIRFAKITEPAMTEMDFFNFVSNAFEMGKTFTSKADFLIELGKFIKESGAQFKKVILVIDEAQRLTTEMLEQIRVFSNIETPGKKGISCIFAGQTEFLDMVKQNRALAQRVFFSHIIQPLTLSETGDYITHRLKVAGTEEQIFTLTAVQEVFRLTGGTPRLINLLCDQALLSGYFHKKRQIGPELIEESTENTLIPFKKVEEQGSTVQMQGTFKQSASTELATVNNTELSQNALETKDLKDLKTPGRKKPYWALAVLISVLGLATYYYLTFGFHFDFNKIRTSLEQTQNSLQPAELRRQKDEAETNLKELKAQFGAIEKNKQDLQVSIGEIQKKMENTGLVQDQLKGEVDTFKKENTLLMTKLVEINNQKNAVEKQTIGFAADTKEMQSIRDHSAQLEAAVSERNKKLNQLDQQVKELKKALDLEKTAKGKMGVELSSRQAAIADLQKQQEHNKVVQLQLATDIENIQRENARLQALREEIKPQKPVPSPPPVQSRAMVPSQATAVAADGTGAAPDPSGAIDSIIGKKSQ